MSQDDLLVFHHLLMWSCNLPHGSALNIMGDNPDLGLGQHS